MTRKRFLILGIILIILTIGAKAGTAAAADTCRYHNVYGYAWSENIGWLNFRCPDTGIHWTLVDDVTPDDDTTKVWTNSAVEQKDAYQLTNPSGAVRLNTIQQIRVFARYQGRIRFYLRLDGVENAFPGSSSGWGAWFNTSSNWTPNRPGGGAWTWNDIDDLQVVVGLNAWNGDGKITQVYVEVQHSSGSVILRPNGTGDYNNIVSPAQTLTPDYGVDIDPNTGVLSGYAWSDNVGWISFNQSDLAGCPVPVGGVCQAKLDLNTKEVFGWARAVLALPPPPPPIPPVQLYEEFNGGGFLFGIAIMAGGSKVAQTFTAGADFTATKADLVLEGSADSFNGNVDLGVSILRTDASGKPTGVDLCSGTISGPSLGLPGSEGWHSVNLSGSNCDLQNGERYAIVAEAIGSGSIKWYVEGTLNFSEGSFLISSIFGGAWNFRVPSVDALFKIYGRALVDPPVPVDPNLGGWDGWIRLRESSGYGLWLDTSVFPHEFRDWAWGGDDNSSEAIIGWLSFNHIDPGTAIDYKVMTDLFFNSPPSATLSDPVESTDCSSGADPDISLSWTFDDPGDTQSAYQIQIDEDSGFGSSRGCPNSGDAVINNSGGNCAPIGLAFGQTYYWRLKVWDSYGADSGWINGSSFTTDIRWPSPGFTYDPLDPIVDDVITFTNSTNYCPACVYSWDFGDGSPLESSPNPTYSYSAENNYNVTLSATNAAGTCDYSENIIVGAAVLPLPSWQEIVPF